MKPEKNEWGFPEFEEWPAMDEWLADVDSMAKKVQTSEVDAPPPEDVPPEDEPPQVDEQPPIEVPPENVIAPIEDFPPQVEAPPEPEHVPPPPIDAPQAKAAPPPPILTPPAAESLPQATAPEDAPLTQCPFCSKEMKKGFIGSGFWGRIADFDWKPEDTGPKNTEGPIGKPLKTVGFSYIRLVAFACLTCGKVISEFAAPAPPDPTPLAYRGGSDQKSKFDWPLFFDDCLKVLKIFAEGVKDILSNFGRYFP